MAYTDPCSAGDILMQEATAKTPNKRHHTDSVHKTVRVNDLENLVFVFTPLHFVAPIHSVHN